MKDKNISNVCLYYLGGNMYKLLRFYNQNRKKLWFIAAIIVFVLIIIQLLNSVAKQQNEEKIRQTEINKNQETTLNNVVSYDKQSEAIISDDNVSRNVRNINGKLLDEFFTYCVNHNPEAAYELLSTDIKNNMYQSEAIFESLYYQSKFEGNKQYSFQAWTTRGDSSNTYKVKIFDDILSTGKADSGYVEDYVTVIKEDDNYKLNIGGFIKKESLNVKKSDAYLTMNVTERVIFMEYEEYTVNIKNTTLVNADICNANDDKGIYLLDKSSNKYYFKNDDYIQNDLLINYKSDKTIKLKFNRKYRKENEDIKSIVFPKINLTNREYYDNTVQYKDSNGNIEYEKKYTSYPNSIIFSIDLV